MMNKSLKARVYLIFLVPLRLEHSRQPWMSGDGRVRHVQYNCFLYSTRHQRAALSRVIYRTFTLKDRRRKVAYTPNYQERYAALITVLGTACCFVSLFPYSSSTSCTVHHSCAYCHLVDCVNIYLVHTLL